MMNRVYVFTIITFCVNVLISQKVGINTITPRGALDIVSSSSGLILSSPTPPMSTSVTSPQAGMLVYNSTSNNVQFTDGTNWTSPWKLNGNSGATTSDFLGTTNSVPLAFRTNNLEALRIGTDQRIGIGTATPQGIVDISGTNSGLVIPRNTNPATNISTNAREGMLVYNSTSKNVQFTDGTNWTSPWKLNGNSATTASDFLGTTDSVPLAFRTNNVEALRIGTDQRVGIGTTTPQGIVDISSTNSTIVLPRNGDPITNVTSAAAGMLIYDSTNKTLRYHDGSQWNTVIASGNQSITTANEGVVKLNSGGATQTKPVFDFKNSGGVAIGSFAEIKYTTPLASINYSAFPTSSWPENNPKNEATGFFYLDGSSRGRFLENSLAGQVHTWRVIVTYSRASSTAAYVTVRMSNPDSTFTIEQTNALAANMTSGTLVFYLMTIADNLSIGKGYQLFISSDTAATLTIDSVTRISQAKD